MKKYKAKNIDPMDDYLEQVMNRKAKGTEFDFQDDQLDQSLEDYDRSQWQEKGLEQTKGKF